MSKMNKMMQYIKFSIYTSKDLEEQIIGIFLRHDLENPIIELKGDNIICSVYLPRDFDTEILKRSCSDETCGQGFKIQENIIDDFWTNRLHGDFSPLDIGPFTIVPSHIFKENNNNKKSHDIIINPAQAFGTGQHETTELVILILDKLDLRSKKVLDVGCGSGILSIASIIKGASSVTGIDIDPLAVENAKENQLLNSINSKLLFSNDNISLFADSEWDIVLANIISGKLIEMKKDFRKLAQNSKLFVFSGITLENESDFLNEFSFLKFKKRHQKGEWVAFICTP